MNEDIMLIIYVINSAYLELSEKWCKSEKYRKINLRKKLIKDICIDENIFLTILNYREFIIKNMIGFLNDIQIFNSNDLRISARIKNRNSVEYKFRNYLENKSEKGEVPLRKCFNDLLGFRIICKDVIEYNELNSHIEKAYPKCWCIDAHRQEGYIANHIYFSNGNYTFPWELQIWNEKNEKNNLKSHAKYKQGYTIWEQSSNKGGVLKW